MCVRVCMYVCMYVCGDVLSLFVWIVCSDGLTVWIVCMVCWDEWPSSSH